MRRAASGRLQLLLKELHVFARLDRGAADRQNDREARPLPDLGAHVDRATVLVDDLADDREAEAGPLADVLGREERIEDLRQHVRGNAVARVRNLDSHRSSSCRAVVIVITPRSSSAWAAFVTRLRMTWLICDGEQSTFGISPNSRRTSALVFSRLCAMTSVLLMPSCRSNLLLAARSRRLKFLRLPTISLIWPSPWTPSFTRSFSSLARPSLRIALAALKTVCMRSRK